MSSNRREFLEAAAALGLGAALPVTRTGRARVGRAAPDLVVLGATVYTLDDLVPKAEAFAITGGRFSAVGSTAEIRALAGPGTEVVDARGLTALPGFIDAHCHPDGVDELIGVNVNLPSIVDVQAALRRKAADTPPGYWVSGYMYDDTKLREGPMTRKDLDAAVPDHPAKVTHRGGHTGVYNSKAFAMAGITADTPDPTGGKFYRENGELTGKVAELALQAFDGVGKTVAVTRDVRRRAVGFISSEMAKAGLTSVHQTGGDVENLTALQDAAASGDLNFRMYLFPWGPGKLYPLLRDAGVRTGFGDERLRIGPVKFAADGSASERTMRMSTPYVGRPNDFGILTMDQAEIHEAVETAHRAGWRVGIHANGDVAIDMVLQAYERVQKLWPREDPRHRIEHCTLVNPELLRRIAAAGVIPTPFYTYVYYHGEKWVEYGDEKLRWMFAHRSFLDYGIHVGPASDYIPGPYEPLMAIQSMVTRTDYRGRVWGANQKITVPEALRICTRGGAYASREEGVKGSITPGKLGDFVLLGSDPHTTDPGAIKDIKVARTVMDGRVTWTG
jgi:predicted amidohydrolase YtcJ